MWPGFKTAMDIVQKISYTYVSVAFLVSLWHENNDFYVLYNIPLAYCSFQ